MPQRISLPRICIALGFPEVETLLAHARKEYDAGERFFEFRLDYLPSPEHGIAAMRKFLSRHADCTILATCRRHQNHGRYNGSVEEQVRILEAAIKAGAKAVDIEIESAENCVERLESLRSHAYLLLSYHNYGGTPPLESVLRRMARIPADGYKIVTTARKPSDNYRVLALARAVIRRRPLVLLAMGETGFPTRVLSTALGRAVHLRRAERRERNRGRTSLRAAASASVSRRKIHARCPHLWSDRRSGPPLDFAGRS